MTWIALKMLVGDKAKFFGIVMGLTFAAMLITQQGSIFCGLMSRTAGQVFDLTGADLWVMDSNVRFIDDVKPMIENNLYRVRGVDGVQWAVPLYKGNARAKLTSYQVDALGQPVFEDAEPIPPPVPTDSTQALSRITGLPTNWLASVDPVRRRYSVLPSPSGPMPDSTGQPIFINAMESDKQFVVQGGLARPLDVSNSLTLVLRDPRNPSTVRNVRRVRYDVIEQVILLGLDDASLVGAPPPRKMLAGSLADLRKPDSILIDYNRLPKLFPGEPWFLKPDVDVKWAFLKDARESILNAMNGTSEDWRAAHREQCRKFYSRFLNRELEMNDRRAVIVGVCEASRTFQSNAVVYTRYSRAKNFIPRERKFLSYILASVSESAGTEIGESPVATAGLSTRIQNLLYGDEKTRQRERLRKEVAARIQEQTGLKARTSQEFIWDTIGYFLKYTGIPINFGITAMLGFLVGTAIAGQTFYLFTIDNLKQFGALKAMGATNLRIVRMILLQAVIVGLLGYGLGVGLACYFGESSKGGELAFYTPWQLLPVTAIAIVLICIMASFVSVRRVVVLEPAVVFRG